MRGSASNVQPSHVVVGYVEQATVGQERRHYLCPDCTPAADKKRAVTEAQYRAVQRWEADAEADKRQANVLCEQCKAVVGQLADLGYQETLPYPGEQRAKVRYDVRNPKGVVVGGGYGGRKRN